jgi:hypothetical protein
MTLTTVSFGGYFVIPASSGIPGLSGRPIQMMRERSHTVGGIEWHVIESIVGMFLAR